MNGPIKYSDEQDSERGIALLLVIWVLSLLAAIAAHVTLNVRTGLDATRGLMELSQARAKAESGVWAALAILVDERTAQTLRLDGTPQRVKWLGDDVVVGIEDERAKVDINVAGETRLRKLFQGAGIDTQTAAMLARNILDYRAGAQTAAPQAKSVVSRVPAFRTTGHLSLVSGFSIQYYERIEPFITVYTDDWRTNPIVAPPIVLLSLPDVDESLVRSYIALRTEQTDEVALRLAGPTAINSQAVWGKPTTITITSTSKLASGATSVLKAIIELNPDNGHLFQVLAWTVDH